MLDKKYLTNEITIKFEQDETGKAYIRYYNRDCFK